MNSVLTQIFKNAHPEMSDDEIQSQIAGASNETKNDLGSKLGVSDSAMNLTPPPDVNSVPSSFDVKDSTHPVTMNGNLPGQQAPEPLTVLPPAPEEPASMPEEAPMAAPVHAAHTTPSILPKQTPALPASKTPGLPEELPTSSNDEAKRNEMMAAAEKRRKLAVIPEVIAGAGDTIGKGLAAFGVHTPTDQQDKLVEMAKKNFDESGQLFETKLQNDPNSDISKAYRQMVTQIAPDMASKPDFQKMSAKAIGDKLPLIDTMMKAQAAKDTKQLGMEQTKLMRDQNNSFKDAQQQAKLEQEHATRLSKIYSNRSGGLGLQDAKVNAAIHSRELIEGARDKDGSVHINQITSPELAMSLASLVSGGNAPAVETIKSMTPEALSGYIKSRIGFLFGKPVDVLPKAWVESLTHQLDRQGLTSEALRNQELTALKGLRPTRLDPTTAQTIENNFSSELPSYSKRYGLDPLDLKKSTGQHPMGTPTSSSRPSLSSFHK